MFSDAGPPSELSTCAHVDAYEALSAAPRRARVYAYQFRDRTATPVVADFPFPNYPEDASHGTVLPYLFEFGVPLTPEQQELSATMVGYWTTFAATGNPNGHGLPAWHRYRDGGDVQGLDLDNAGGVAPVDVARESHCAFWASIAQS